MPNGPLKLCHLSRSIAQNDFQKFKAKTTKENNILDPLDFYTGEYDISVKKSLSGKEKLESLEKALNRLDEWFLRSNDQRQFHKAFTTACLPKIFGDELTRNLHWLSKVYRFTQLRPDVLICTPRRRGKTMATALFAAAYAYSQPESEISIFSPGRRQSRKILALVWQMILKLANEDRKIIDAYNQEELKVHSQGGGISKVYSYPAKVQIDNHKQPKEFTKHFQPTPPTPTLKHPGLFIFCHEQQFFHW